MSKIGDADTIWSWIKVNIYTQDATGGFKKFPDYSFTRGLIDALTAQRILIVCKSRQMMATWSVCAWMLYRALNEEPGVYLMLCKGERDSRELLKRLRIMYSLLPENIRIQEEMTRNSDREVVFASGSRILSLPATEEAPRMHSPSGVFWDEMAFTSHSDGIWTAVKPAIDSGGSFVGVSTPNGTDNVFYDLYSDKSNGFGKLRIHWKEHPHRDDEWLNDAKKGLSKARWQQEYELDFGALADRVYDEFETSMHILDSEFRWVRGGGRTYRSIDFGYRHPYVIWLHISPAGDMIVFDEWEGNDATVDEMVEAIRKIDARHGITEEDITWSGCDPAGAAVNDDGISSVGRLNRKGFKLAYRKSEIMNGVELVKSLLRDANGIIRLRFSPNVKKTVYHLQHYRWESGRDKPRKDNLHDHAVDALRYLIINLSGGRSVKLSRARVAGGKW
ncbi:hypothetical protein HQ587_06015 [bacterium]|nr:hypothetical protein [bacterium]